VRNLDFTAFSARIPGVTTAYEDTTNTDRSLSLQFASFAVPWSLNGRNLVVQLSYQRTFDFTYNSDVAYVATASGGSAYQEIIQNVHQTGGVAQYSAALGVEVSHHVLFGMAVNRWQGHANFNSQSQRTTTGTEFHYDSDLSQESSFQGLNATLGLLWRSSWLHVGLTWRSPFQATFVFSDAFTHPDPTTGGTVQQIDPATSSTVHWPETWAGGVGLHLGGRLLLAADWSFTPWSHTRISNSGTILDGRNWFDLQAASVTPKATDQRFGAEWLAVVRPGLVLPVRAGLFREPQPIVDTQTRAQRILEGWTVGAGLRFHDLTLDLALKASHARRAIARYNTDAPAQGIASTAFGFEHLVERRFYVSCIYQFQSEPILRALKSVLD
jgi:hypothetical protein